LPGTKKSWRRMRARFPEKPSIFTREPATPAVAATAFPNFVSQRMRTLSPAKVKKVKADVGNITRDSSPTGSLSDQLIRGKQQSKDALLSLINAGRNKRFLSPMAKAESAKARLTALSGIHPFKPGKAIRWAEEGGGGTWPSKYTFLPRKGRGRVGKVGWSGRTPDLERMSLYMGLKPGDPGLTLASLGAKPTRIKGQLGYSVKGIEQNMGSGVIAPRVSSPHRRYWDRILANQGFIPKEDWLEILKKLAR
jgi:hypothetical protein